MITEQAIHTFNISSLLFTILLWVGWIQSTPVLFQQISFVVKCVVGILLMYKFNDFWPSKTFTVIDRKICFLAGTYIVTFTLGDFLKRNIVSVI
jgi:hypothetical protein